MYFLMASGLTSASHTLAIGASIVTEAVAIRSFFIVIPLFGFPFDVEPPNAAIQRARFFAIR
jgi:hypothetical protein